MVNGSSPPEQGLLDARTEPNANRATVVRYAGGPEVDEESVAGMCLREGMTQFCSFDHRQPREATNADRPQTLSAAPDSADNRPPDEGNWFPLAAVDHKNRVTAGGRSVKR